ncbi:MAG TPA: carboxypeptidase-like regulatory domain-containing protein [Chthoniobacterales bacterium]
MMKNKQMETKFKPGLDVTNYLLPRSLAGLIFGSIFLATAAMAQSTTIEGVVRGPDGKPMKSTDVRLESKAKGTVAQTIKTDNSGRYRFSNVGVGKYRVTVLSGSQVQGFMDNVNTSTSKAAKVDFDIKGGAAGQPKKAKHLVWVPSETGTHLGGHWVEEDDTGVNPERVEKKSGAALQNMQRTSGASNQPGGG